MNRNVVVTDRRKLRQVSAAYRVASEALEIAAKHGCDDAVLEELVDLCRREELAWRMRENLA